MARTLTRFGGALVLSTIATLLLVNAEKGILASLVSTRTLGHYAVAFALARMLTMFAGSMTQSLIPAFSQLQGEEKLSQLNSLYSRGIRMTVIWSIPAMVVLALIAEPFFNIWAGSEFGRESTLPLHILLAGLAFNVVAYFPHTSILASGRSDVLAKLYWIELGPYLVSVWLLASSFGAKGAAAAWSARVIIDAIIQFLIARKVACVRLSIRNLKLGVVAIALMLLPLLRLFSQSGSRTMVIIGTGVCGVLFMCISWKYVLEKEESDWIIRWIKGRIAGAK